MEYANYIARCIEIARRGEYFVAPNPMVGAVLVRNSDEKILAEGWHERYGEGHAEVNCFRKAEGLEYDDTCRQVDGTERNLLCLQYVCRNQAYAEQSAEKHKEHTDFLFFLLHVSCFVKGGSQDPCS